MIISLAFVYFIRCLIPVSALDVKCPPITPPANGAIVPRSCQLSYRDYGRRCVSYCYHGYRLIGSATRYCQADKQWSPKSDVQCIKVIEQSYLNCPADIMVTLPADKGEMELGKKFPKPQTNMKITSVSHIVRFVFPVGTTNIRFTAVDNNGVTKTCNVLIDVKDITNPTMVNCPSDILKMTHRSSKIITWTEPTFTDNVGIHRLEKAHVQPGQPWIAGTSAMLQYRALDKAGNQMKCTFKVTLKSIVLCTSGTHNCHSKASCYKSDGNFTCTCIAGYTGNGVNCTVVKCAPLTPPSNGSIVPAKCLVGSPAYGERCVSYCKHGYRLIGNATRYCQADRQWLPIPNVQCIKAVDCPPLTPPINGGIVPGNCLVGSREYGQRCVSYCKHGYRLRGSATRYCQGDKQWLPISNVQCIKVIEQSYLNCPADIMVTLPADKGGMELGTKFPKPQTNMNITSVSHIVRFVFPAGTTIVRFTAVDKKGVTKTCNVLIDVKDITKPTMTNCPSDILKTTHKFTELITWTEPTFTDNVGIHRLEKSHIPTGQPWRAGESAMLQYRALDKAGNEVRCTFRVTLKSLYCQPLTGDKYTYIHEFTRGKSYNVACKWNIRRSRCLFGPYGTSGGAAMCNNGDYMLNGNFIGPNAPHCVLFSVSTKTAACDYGQQKFEATDWFGRKSYYCANCPPGSGFNVVTGKCIPCPVDSYQDEEGKIKCKKCNKTQTTLKAGSESKQECIEKCAAGYYSSSGLNEPKNPCTICPKGTYNGILGGTECRFCPDGKSTISTGATDISQCLGKPIITDYEPKAKKIVRVAETVVFECFYSATPTPTATWKKVSGGTTTGIVTDIYNVQFEKVGVALAIFGATLADTGMYECSVTNKMGRDARTVELAVN